MNKEFLEQIKVRTMEQILQEREDAQEHQADNIKYIINTFINWRGWYCKKNQPKNYMRLMCRKPDHKHWKDVRYAWNCRLQVFKGQKFECDIRITADAYDTFCEYIKNIEGWKPAEESDIYEARIYENPKKA
jgi:hypothetical protein